MITNYQILADSSCDLPFSLARSLGVSYAPLRVQFQGAEYENFLDGDPRSRLDIKAFYSALRTGTPTSTTAVNPEGWSALMTPVLEAAKSDDPLVVSGDELKDVLESCGVSEDKRMQFGAQFDESFGGGAVLNPRNLIDVKKCVVKTPDVSITVNPDRPDLIETRTLGGVRYILIKADEGVELNGIDLAEEA